MSELHYEMLILVGLSILCSAHFWFLMIPNDVQSAIVVLPLVLIGLGHAVFSLMMGPIMPKVIANKEILTNCLSIQKIVESIIIMVFTQAVGSLRGSTGNYTAVSRLELAIVFTAMVMTVQMIPSESLLAIYAKMMLYKTKWQHGRRKTDTAV